MATIASKVIGDLRKQSSNVVDLAAFRAARQTPKSTMEAKEDDGFLDEHDDTPEGFRFWMVSLRHLMGMAHGLLGSRHMRRFAEKIDATEKTYMPGGPPMSPLTDSFHALWYISDLCFGLKRESLSTITISVARSVRGNHESLDSWKTIANSYAGVYRIESRDGNIVELCELVTGSRHVVELADSIDGQPGEIWWTRILPPAFSEHQYSTSIGTPYRFISPDAEEMWLGYFDRQLGTLPAPKREAGYRRLMKRGATPEAWLEFILDAYAGQEGMAVLLQGVPDLPESLPCSRQNEDEEDDKEHALMSPLHKELLPLVREMELADCAAEDFAITREDLGLPKAGVEEWSDPERQLFFTYLMYECVDYKGQRALDKLDRSALALEDREHLATLEKGWFSLFEVLHIKPDECIEVKDLIRKRRFWITERMATRNLSVGDSIACWLLKRGDETFIEGALGHLPSVWTPLARDVLEQVVASMKQQKPSMHWRKRQAHLVPWVAGLIAKAHIERPPISPLSSVDVPMMPPEVREQLTRVIHSKLSETLDMPVPMLGGKTPRQMVHTEKGRKAVTSWLLDQERINEAHPQMSALVDTGFMWDELGLVAPNRR